MSKETRVRRFFKKSGWYSVFHFEDDRGSARSYLLFASIVQSIVNGLMTGVFYSGYLGSFGIDIVNISILMLIPYITSLFSLLTPVILERHMSRRKILTASRIAYYTINILGLTFLPLAVHSQQGRVFGLVCITFLANAINSLFTSGYSAWHMGYIDPEIRSGYMTANTLMSSAISGILMLALGAITDSFQGKSQQILLAGFRCAAFLIAMLDVYFLQKPKEPEYKVSEQNRLSIIRSLKIPLSNKRFILIMTVYLLHASFSSLVNSVVTPWLLEEIKVSYAYINFINLTNVFFILPTSTFWGKYVRKHGTLGTLALAQALMVPSYILHALMTESNYLWVMTAVKLIQNCVNLGTTICVNSLIYIALPEENQTDYLSFYQILVNMSALLGMSVGTWVVAAMGDQTVLIAGFRFSSVPVLFLIQAAAFSVLPVFVCRAGRRIEPEGWQLSKQRFHFPFNHRQDL